MIAVDTNVLVHAHRGDSPFHEAAVEAVRELAEGSERWAIPWPCIHELIAITTHQRVFDPPSGIEDIFDQIAAWTQSPSLVLLSEDERYLEQLRSLALPRKVVGPRIHDARIAALCLRHGVRLLLSADRDFSRFPELRVQNPLVA